MGNYVLEILYLWYYWYMAAHGVEIYGVMILNTSGWLIEDMQF
jgi:hypothetical protein